MGRLSAKDLRSRLAYDARVCARLHSPHLTLTGHVSAEAMQAGTVATEVEAEAGRVVFYMARFAFPVLINAGATTPSSVLSFNLLAGGSYPFSDPVVTVISRPLPWSPHVYPGSGSVCTGEEWGRSGGRMLMAQMVLHSMRVLNCDEPDREARYVGWNGEAVRYWRDVMKCRPLNPGLVYPMLPEDLTHGITAKLAFTALAPSAPAAPTVGFRAVAPAPPSAGGLFRAAPQAPAPTFRRVRGG